MKKLIYHQKLPKSDALVHQKDSTIIKKFKKRKLFKLDHLLLLITPLSNGELKVLGLNTNHGIQLFGKEKIIIQLVYMNDFI